MQFYRKLMPNEHGIISAKELMNAIFNNEPIEPINGVVIEGAVELNSVDYGYKLVIRKTVFQGHFDVSEAHFKRSLDLCECIFEENVNFSGTTIDSSLVLAKAKIQAPPNRSALKNFERIHVQGILDASALQSEVTLNFNHSHIGKLVLCSLEQNQTICKDIRLLGAKIVHQIDCSGAKVHEDLMIQGADIQGDLFCNTEAGYCTEIGGDVCLVGVRVLGRVDLSGAKIKGNLNLDSAEIHGALDCKPEQDKSGQWYYTEITGDAYLGGAKVSLLVNFSGTKIEGSLSLQAAEIKGDVWCQVEADRHTEIGGKVDFIGAQVTGSVNLSGATIAQDIEFKGAEIKGDICCCSKTGHRTEIKGKADLVEVQVLGSVDFSGATIGEDLLLKRAEIKSQLDCELSGDERTEIGGNINIAGAKIQGNVNFGGAKIAKDLVLKGVEIAGSVDCSSQEFETKKIMVLTEIDGKVNLIRAQILSSVDFRGSRIRGKLELDGADLTSNFFCDLSQIENTVTIKACSIRCLNITINPNSDNAKLILAFTKVIRLEIKDALPRKEHIDLEGFEFQQLDLAEGKGYQNKYIQFLEASSPFHESSYLFMENWLRNIGAQIDADLVYVAMRRRSRRENVSLELQKPWGCFLSLIQQSIDRFLDFTIRYGTANHRLFFFYFLPVLMISWLLFLNTKAVEIELMPTTKDLQNSQVIELSDPKQPKLKEQLSVFPTTWTQTDAFWLALQVNLPVVSFNSANKWSPSSQNISIFQKEIPLTYSNYASTVTLASWIAVPLFLAGVSGIVKKQT